MKSKDNDEFLESCIANFLKCLAKDYFENPLTEPHLLKTPKRVAHIWKDRLLDGYQKDPKQILSCSIEQNSNKNGIGVLGINFYSFCPHHLFPYIGTAKISYIPTDKIIGFSKLVELVDCWAHRFILQEELTQNVAQSIVDYLPAKAALCVIEANQICLAVKKNGRAGLTATMGWAGDNKYKDELKSLLLSQVVQNN